MRVEGKDATAVVRLIEALEELTTFQSVYANHDDSRRGPRVHFGRLASGSSASIPAWSAPATLIEPGAGGVAVLDRGVIATSADVPLEARIHRIYDGVRGLLERPAPTTLVLEDLYTEYRFPRTALLTAHAARRHLACAARQC